MSKRRNQATKPKYKKTEKLDSSNENGRLRGYLHNKDAQLEALNRELLATQRELESAAKDRDGMFRLLAGATHATGGRLLVLENSLTGSQGLGLGYTRVVGGYEVVLLKPGRTNTSIPATDDDIADILPKPMPEAEEVEHVEAP